MLLLPWGLLGRLKDLGSVLKSFNNCFLTMESLDILCSIHSYPFVHFVHKLLIFLLTMWLWNWPGLEFTQLLFILLCFFALLQHFFKPLIPEAVGIVLRQVVLSFLIAKWPWITVIHPPVRLYSSYHTSLPPILVIIVVILLANIVTLGDGVVCEPFGAEVQQKLI